MPTVVDVSSACGSKSSAMHAVGIRTVIRYYSRDTIRASKRLSREEAVTLAAAGLRLGIVHEGRHGDVATNFDRPSGIADALYARTYGASIVGQPAGSTIYFGVDFDATSAEIRDRVIPYFQGIVDAFARPTGEPDYAIGVYGSGATCKALLDAGLVRRAWLAQSTGWSGYSAFSESGRWALRQGMPTTIVGVECDPNEVAEHQDIGDFVLPVGPVAMPMPSAARMRVNARNGLRLRAGPGVEFDIAKLLPFGTVLYPLKSIGSWTMVDLEGDGIADGFVSGAYLTDDKANVSSPQATSATPNLFPSTVDAMHVPELVRQGTSAEGLKAARE